ncbi:MAG TPA: TolC family protein [Steroidobacteraceae bacterium]
MIRRIVIAVLGSISLASAAIGQTVPRGSATVPVEPLTLDGAHALALKNHPGAAAADYRAQAATEVFKQARSGLLPQVNLYASAVDAGSDNTRIMAGGLNNPSVFDRKALGVGASQLITDFGRTSNLAASARLQASAAEQGAAATREQVLLDVDRTYFGELQATAVERVAQQTVSTRQLLLDRVNILAQNKLKSDLDVSFAKVALADGQLLLQKAQNDSASARAALSAALGYRELHEFTLVESNPGPAGQWASVDPLIEQALHDRPDLVGLRDERDAAQRYARSQHDARLPSISAVIASGGAVTRDDRLPANYTAAGLQLSMPVFTGGYYSARQHEAELRAKAADESLRLAEDNVTRDVRVAWLSLNNARQRMQTTDDLRRYAAQAYDLADARYRAGSSSIVELSQAQLELTSAEIANTGARYDVLLQEALLNFQIGALLKRDAPAAPSALP